MRVVLQFAVDEAEEQYLPAERDCELLMRPSQGLHINNRDPQKATLLTISSRPLQEDYHA